MIYSLLQILLCFDRLQLYIPCYVNNNTINHIVIILNTLMINKAIILKSSYRL